MADIKILDVRRLAATAADRVGKFDRTVLYQIDGARVSLLRMPDENFTEADLLARIKKELEAHTALVGKTYKT